MGSGAILAKAFSKSATRTFPHSQCSLMEMYQSVPTKARIRQYSHTVTPRHGAQKQTRLTDHYIVSGNQLILSHLYILSPFHDLVSLELPSRVGYHPAGTAVN
ncbi:hypothetical protein V6Z88_001359 [Aspergillus fumigatus]